MGQESFWKTNVEKLTSRKKWEKTWKILGKEQEKSRKRAGKEQEINSLDLTPQQV